MRRVVWNSFSEPEELVRRQVDRQGRGVPGDAGHGRPRSAQLLCAFEREPRAIAAP